MEMVEWLKSHGITHAAMEATGNFWMPVYNLLEGHFELIVTNAAHMKAVPGRKDDVNMLRGSASSFAMACSRPA